MGIGFLGNSDGLATSFMGGMYPKASEKHVFFFFTRLEGLGTAKTLF